MTLTTTVARIYLPYFLKYERARNNLPDSNSFPYFLKHKRTKDNLPNLNTTTRNADNTQKKTVGMTHTNKGFTLNKKRNCPPRE